MNLDQRLLDLNRYGVLSPPASLWWSTAFLLRHWILMVFVAVSARRSPETLQWAYGAFSIPLLLSEAPMLLLAGAWLRRVPEAGALTRQLWRRGREIIMLTAGLNLLWTAWFLWSQDVWNPWPERFMAVLALVDAAIIVGCWQSAVYRALFDDFPPPAASNKGRTP